MNRITRLAAFALSFAAAGSAFAESPDAAGPQITPARAAAVSAPTAMAATGIVTEADLQRAADVASTRSRADVRAATRAAIANGELPRVSVDSNAFAVDPLHVRTDAGQRVATAGR